ncbi:hypothetical protein GQR58_011204 [Nymphon striatum]|nr:hypothetical protein GQR58_011204 [Nymphon striatum]
MKLTMKKDIFLSNPQNKQRLLNMLSESLNENNCKTLHAESDADVLIAQTAVEAANLNTTVLVGDDTDLLILLCHHFKPGRFDLYFQPEPKVNSKKNSTWNIKLVKQDLGDAVCDGILFIHAILGSDTTSHVHGFGKGASLKMFTTSKQFQNQASIFYNETSTKDDIIEAGEKALVLYNGQQDDTLNGLRYKKFCEKVATKSSHVQPQSIPPTTRAAKFHSLRVYHQVQEWKANQHLLPTEWGWKLLANKLVPIQTDLPPAPEDLLMILCPVCRVEITYQIPQNKDEFPPPVEEINDSCDVNNSMLKEQQKILSEIYEKQKANGGIIDLEQEKTKFLLNISAPSSVNEIEVTPEEASSAPTKNKLANDDGTKKCTGESNQSQYFRKNNYDNKNDYRNRSKHYNFKDVQPNSANFVMSESSKDSANDDGTKKCTGESNQSQYFRKNNYDNKNDCRNRSKHYNFKDVQPNSANSLTSESSKDSYAKQQDLQNHKSDSKVFNNFCQKPNENYYTRSKHYNHYNTKPNSAHFKKSRSSQNSSFTKQQNLQNPSNDISDSRVSDNSQSQNAVGVEFTKQNCGDSQKTKSSSKYQTYKNQNFFHSQNLKSQGDSSSAKHKDVSKNVDHDPKMDEGQIHRQPVSRARKPRVGKSDECSSLSTTTSRKNEKTCSDISNDISTNGKKLSDKLSVTASVGNLSIEPSVKPPPGFLPKFKNLKGVPPPGFTSR